ncbi:germinal-center associated nuclear protein [Echinops telfairi]|uniref:Germinal-center associated nuclear protein n=1 Tax=Echinops telfairi TaxID=9371 RepID=A0ABM0ID30_ECHTE|nr:germinal-center associated nuclear protein [Echinops telfairi]
MNPSNPFSGQQPGMFSPSSSSTLGAFHANQPFQFGQPSLFGQNNPSPGQSSGFSHMSSFPAPSGASHSSSGPTSNVGLFSGLEHSSTFAAASGSSSSSMSGNPGFSFKSPTNLGVFPHSSPFGLEAGERVTSGFGKTEFRFKPLENAMFRPILGAEAEPEKTQSQIPSGFFSFSHPVNSGSRGLAPFSVPPGTSNSSTNSNFTFSKPVNNSNSSSSVFAPALSNQSVEEEKRAPKSLFGGSHSSFTTFPASSSGALGDPFAGGKIAVRQGCEEAVSQVDPLPSLVKGLKRKEDQDRSPRRHDRDIVEDSDSLSRSDHPPPDKRPVHLNRPRGGTLFDRTLQDVLKSNKDVGRVGKELKRESGCVESEENTHLAVPGGSPSVLALSRLSGVKKEEETEGRSKKEDSLRGTPAPRKRGESTDSLGGVSSTELTAIQCKNIPDYLNDRSVLEKHFNKIAKVQRVYTRRSKKLAVVYFFNHASAALARKKGKSLHEDVTIFWHKKKASPNKKPFIPKEKQPGDGDANLGREDVSSHSPLCKPVSRVAASSGLLSKSSPVKKPSILKVSQFDGDRFDSGSESAEALGLCVSSLNALLGTVAETAEEKYRLLDQRDRVMRQARVRRTDLDKARTFVGTCPDMCPEKERYMRETRSQLSVFEVIPGTDQVDHAAAVKEYSRSSADQEEPLPHELRPSAVLSRTMDYLVTQIMDQKEGSLRDWYDFVWNRTRGIRKDITQQHLCDPLTVSLIEKCMRFHIHCAHFMCEEPMSSFDAKINNENMTKCLQSLKEMYQDLRNKSISCVGEAEFQGYNVLLNLNKGDILREVQQFSAAVRNSPEVNFAVQAFAALNSNNFVRFFKLVQSTSYLNACLLHCYFNQIRKDALRALNMAYTVSTQRATAFPLDSVVRMLLFQDGDEAVDFLSLHGLTVSEGYVELNRSAFLEPEGLTKAKKSVFVTQKLKVSIGEIVNGGPLPPVPSHTPMCSFNSQNKYVGESLVVEPAHIPQRPATEATGVGREERRPEPTMPLPGLLPQPLTHMAMPGSLPRLPAPSSAVVPGLFQPPTQPEPLPPRMAPVYSDSDIAQVVDEIIQEVLQRDCEEVGTLGAEYTATALGASVVALDELLGAATEDILRVVAAEGMNEVQVEEERRRRRVEQERLRQERELLLSQLSQGLAVELTELVVTECVHETAAQELRCALEADQRARLERCCEDVSAHLADLFVEEETFQTAKETLQELRCFCKYLQRKRHFLLRSLLLNLGHAGKMGISCTRLKQLRDTAAHRMKVQHFHQQLLREKVWAPLDLPTLVAQHLPEWQEHMFWKVVLVLPDEEDLPSGSPSRLLANWLKVKFTGVVSGALSDHALDAVQAQKDLLGASGLLLLLPAQVQSEDEAEEDVYWLSALLQLKQLLQVKPCLPEVPLAVLIPSLGSDTIERDVEDGLMLQDLVSAKLISDYTVIEIPDSISDLRGTAKVSQAVQWLVSRCPRTLDLCCQTLTHYVEDGLTREFSDRFFHDRRERRLAGLASQEPGAVIELFNSVLHFLASVASFEQLCELSWPIAEFAEVGGSQLLPHLHWNSPEHLAWLKQAVLAFQIPQMDLPPPGAPWTPVCAMILQYVSQVSSSCQTQPVLQSQVERLLSRTYSKWRSQSPTAGQESGPAVSEIPWDDLLALCIDHKLRDWAPPRLPVSSEAVSEDGQICVYFFKNHLKKYEVPLSWEQARTQTQKELQRSQGCLGVKSLHPSVNHFPTTLLHVHLKQKSPAAGWKEGVPRTEDLICGASAGERLAQCLASSLLLEKEESRRFEDQLQRWLSEDSGAFANSTFLPLYLPQTLVSLPHITQPANTSTSTSPQSKSTGEHVQPSEVKSGSLTERLKHLERLIQSSKEEEVASELHLSTLLDMVDI